MSARILVVDDILPNVKLLEARLSSEYFDVITAMNGEEALKKIDEQSPDIVLLDVMMPGMTGFEVCEKIKANPMTAHIPVVMVTALSEPQDRVKGLSAGADDFLSKPVNEVALMARVRSLVRLKMSVDEWRVRANTAAQLGVSSEAVSAMSEPAESADVLIVEDQSFEADKMRDAFARDRHDVRIVSTGLEALQVVMQNDIDLIVISLNLAREDGLRLCSHFKSQERSRGVPLLMLGTDDDMPRIAHGLEMGAHDYLLRPIDKNELLARARTQIRRKRFQEKLRANYELSLSMALSDPLTNVYNRRYFDAHMQKLAQKNRDNKKYLGLLLLDIDHFKKVNDTYGHGVGDDVLKIFAHRVKDALRSFDLVARLGGEEFAVVLPDVLPETAYAVAERLRRKIAEKPFPCTTPTGEISITTSIGGYVVTDDDYALPIDAMMKHADDALYQAKESGRDRVVFHGIGFIDPQRFKPTLRPTDETPI